MMAPKGRLSRMHAFLLLAPSPEGGPVLFFLPISALVVASAAVAAILDVRTSRERAFYANLGVGSWSVYGAAVLWLGFLETLLGLAVLVLGPESGP